MFQLLERKLQAVEVQLIDCPDPDASRTMYVFIYYLVG